MEALVSLGATLVSVVLADEEGEAALVFLGIAEEAAGATLEV